MCNVERISGVLGKLRFSRALRLSSKRITSRKDVVSRSTQKGFAFFRALRLSPNDAPLEKASPFLDECGSRRI